MVLKHKKGSTSPSLVIMVSSQTTGGELPMPIIRQESLFGINE
ncbi:hypothetical protein SAMN05720591_12515 [Halolactibacillus alkaliphilus]|nr:hypothetical protein SAMN05720591_12515 [Halolactibacillus alkaliphilus]